MTTCTIFNFHVPISLCILSYIEYIVLYLLHHIEFKELEMLPALKQNIEIVRPIFYFSLPMKLQTFFHIVLLVTRQIFSKLQIFLKIFHLYKLLLLTKKKQKNFAFISYCSYYIKPCILIVKFCILIDF